MLKYLETRVTFSEVPDEVTLCINITKCPYNCDGCHSSQLREDIGEELNTSNLLGLIRNNEGISCVAFMGGDREPDTISKMCKYVHNQGLKTCWYSGNVEVSPYIDLRHFDFIKIGPYIKSLGGLDSPITNQKMFKVIHTGKSAALKDISYKFDKHETDN